MPRNRLVNGYRSYKQRVMKTMDNTASSTNWPVTPLNMRGTTPR